MLIPEKTRRYIWASLLLALPLFAYPLAWALPRSKSLPLWDMVQCCTPAVIAIAALGAAVAEPRRIIKAWQSSKVLRFFLITSLLCSAAAGVQQILYGGLWENFFHALFFVTLPWAGIALAPELKRLLPWWCSGLFLFLLWMTAQTPMCTGFVGNWNWNFSLLAVTLVAIVVLTFRSRWRLIAAGVAVSAGVASVFFFFPELAPRGTLAGIIGAAVALGIVMLFKRQERWQYAMIAVLAVGILSSQQSKVRKAPPSPTPVYSCGAAPWILPLNTHSSVWDRPVLRAVFLPVCPLNIIFPTSLRCVILIPTMNF